LHLNKAKNADNASALASIFNKVEMQKNKQVEIEPPADEDTFALQAARGCAA